MAHNVIMPQMGESVAEGTIVRWLKAVGDEVDRDEPIFEITTDKVDAEIPAPESGVLLEIKVEAGETVEVGTLVAVIGAAGEQPTASAAAPAEPAEVSAPEAVASTPAPAAVPSGGSADATAAELRRTKSTPVVRKIAQEHGINIAQVAGTGLDGRVTKKDILAFIEAGGAAAAAPAPAALRTFYDHGASWDPNESRIARRQRPYRADVEDAAGHQRPHDRIQAVQRPCAYLF